MAHNELIWNTKVECVDIHKYSSEDILLLTINIIFAVFRSVIYLIYINSNVIMCIAVLSLILFIIHKSYWSPILYTKELTDIGFDHIPQGPDRTMHISRVQSSRKLGKKLPPPYPNGWFVVCGSRDLKVGGVIAVDALGQNLCVYRGEDGSPRCVDAYCPHLGANLAIGGTVCGNCIECPFHQWRFGEGGACVGIPGVEAVPKGIGIKTWPTMEADAAVWIWYDAEGREPMWRAPDSKSKNWGYRGRSEFLVNAHIQEIPENGADVAHLNAVHTTSLITEIADRFPFLHQIVGHHVWSAEWKKTDEDHIAIMNISQKYTIMKRNVFPCDVVVYQIGPGHVRMYFDTMLGPAMVSQSVTPMGPLVQKVVHRLFSPTYNALFGTALVLAEAYQFQRDVRIWNSKKYVNAPTYVKTDRTIRMFRAWFSQFYSEHSVSLRETLQNPLDW